MPEGLKGRERERGRVGRSEIEDSRRRDARCVLARLPMTGIVDNDGDNSSSGSRMPMTDVAGGAAVSSGTVQ